MPRKPDVPCARCGRLLFSSPTSLPAGQRKCHPCRRAEPAKAPLPRAVCLVCGVEFAGRGKCCSIDCANVRRRGASPRRGRVCVICGGGYDASYAAQRTCGRECGKAFQPKAKPKPPPSSKVFIRECAECSVLFVARLARQVTCGSECSRRRQNRQTTTSIMKRYRSDPEFRDMVLARSHARRADKLGLGNVKITLSYLIERDKGRCGICRKPVRAKRGPMRPSIDHVLPLACGGIHELANVQLAHYRCNLSKNNRGGGEQLLLVG